MRTLFTLAFALFFLLAGTAAPAQDATGTVVRKGLILTLNRPLDREVQVLFQDVIGRSVRWNLERRNLGVVEKNAPAFEIDGIQDPLRLLDSSDRKRADYVLLLEYANRGRDLEIRMVWYDPHSAEKLEEVTRRGRKDLVLDRMIREVLTELLLSVEDSLASLPLRELPAEQSIFTPMTVDSEVISPVPESPPQRRKYVEISLGCAPFITTGGASEYFKLGILPAMNLSYLFRGESSRFALGLYTGLNYFSASGAIASSDNFIIPIGLSGRYELGNERYPTVIFGISARPALFLMNSTTGGMLRGLTFYGRGSLGVRLPIDKTFGITLEAGYELYWEEPSPIMGFSPSAAATIRL